MAGENYIGSKISLISLSDIRYVGILHSINAQDSTVGLKQVRSFGTEGRRGKPEEEILASDNVFDYVVFRGSDIKDLQVFEAPPKPTPPPQPAMPQDPAIMSMSGYPPMNPYMNNNMYMQPSPQQAPPQQAPKQPQPQQQQQQPPQQQQQQQQQQQRPSNDSSYWQPSYPAEPKVDQAQLEKNTLDELKAELEETDALQPTINEAAIEQLAKKVSELNTGDDAVIGSKPSSDEQQPRRRYDNNNNNSNYRNRNNRFNNNNSNSNNFGDRQYSNNKNKAEFSIPNSEFDFEASNAKFDKSEVVKKDGEEVNDEEAEEIEIPQPDEFYDKTSSFFDNISCESKERNEQRQQNEPRRSHFHEERKLNLETFGQATVDQSRYRNNYRGRGGYRGGRGGNNYYRNNNRNNNTYNNNNSNGYRQNNKGQDQQDAL